MTGFVLAGVGHRTAEGQNFFIVKPDTEIGALEEAFKTITSRTDVAILLINQHVSADLAQSLLYYVSNRSPILSFLDRQ